MCNVLQFYQFFQFSTAYTPTSMQYIFTTKSVDNIFSLKCIRFVTYRIVICNKFNLLTEIKQFLATTNNSRVKFEAMTIKATLYITYRFQLTHTSYLAADPDIISTSRKFRKKMHRTAQSAPGPPTSQSKHFPPRSPAPLLSHPVELSIQPP